MLVQFLSYHMGTMYCNWLFGIIATMASDWYPLLSWLWSRFISPPTPHGFKDPEVKITRYTLQRKYSKTVYSWHDTILSVAGAWYQPHNLLNSISRQAKRQPSMSRLIANEHKLPSQQDKQGIQVCKTSRVQLYNIKKITVKNKGSSVKHNHCRFDR